MDGSGDAFAPLSWRGTSGFGAPLAASRPGPASFPAERQRTLAAPISCQGIGLHGGHPVRLVLSPAPADHGIRFFRSDLGVEIPARADQVSDTRLCTVLGHGAARIGTVEHLLAALAGLGIDNAHIALDGPEIPILDGSAEPFLFLIDCAGIAPLPAPRRRLSVRRPVRVDRGDAWAEFLPSPDGRFHLEMEIDFAAPAIGRQSLALTLDPASFRRELAPARTFTLARDVANLQESGLALGGSLDNALVVQHDRVLNPGGLRVEREFVRHKLLDVVGDLALAGHPIAARFRGHRGGHALNAALLAALLADPANFTITQGEDPAWLSEAA